MFIDFHGHVNRFGTFLYGNSIKGPQQVDNVLFAKLLAINSLNFEFDGCNFKEANMVAKDGLDRLSREGSSRVAIHKETQLPNCYTIEASFQGSKKLHDARKIVDPEDQLTNAQSKVYDGKAAAYSPIVYEDIGRVLICYYCRPFVLLCWITMTIILSQEFLTPSLKH